MKSKLLCQGAEAKIILSDNFITKDRIKKSYRIPELDEKIRKRRTKSEAKLLEKASKIINCPKPLETLKYEIKMPFIDGKKLSEHLDNFPLKQQKQICNKIGESIAKLHEQNIIHSDLTTSNMIYVPNKKDFVSTKEDDKRKDKVYFIDFGLGFISHKYEDKAVDLHLLKQALEAKHFKNWETLFNEVIKQYKKYSDSKIILERLKAVEKRGRYIRINSPSRIRTWVQSSKGIDL